MKRFTKHIAAIYLLGVYIFMINPAIGQVVENVDGLAGPDRRTCKESENIFNTLPVTIGPAHAVSGWCYRWTPTTGLSNPYISNPEAKPDQTTVYTLTITGDNFEYEVTDQMTVYVEEINSLNATPKLCCFKSGTKFTPEMFTITTDPPGLDRQVEFDPPTAPNPGIGLQSEVVNITVSTKCAEWSGPVQQIIQVLVVNEDAFATLQFSIGNLEKAFAKVSKALTQISKKSEIPGSPCSLTPPGITLTFAVSKGTLCCPKKGCAIDQYKASGTYKACTGFDCNFPIPYASLPGFASLNLAVNFNCCLGLGVEYKEKCDGGDVCLKGTSELNLGVGLSGIILHKDIFKAALLGVSTINTPTFEICVPSFKFTFLGPVCYTLDLVGSITTFSYFQRAVKYTIIPKSCWGDTGVIY